MAQRRVGTILREERERLGLSQVQVAERTKGAVPQATISKIERGGAKGTEEPGATFVALIAWALGLSVDDVMSQALGPTEAIVPEPVAEASPSLPRPLSPQELEHAVRETARRVAVHHEVLRDLLGVPGLPKTRRDRLLVKLEREPTDPS